jgi:hypothetical protein
MAARYQKQLKNAMWERSGHFGSQHIGWKTANLPVCALFSGLIAH